ncbi:hypothetical protein [Nitrosarchaeum sp.]|uniref:hypothetical protein n=1 Tax=Nitrosarchaeum sp. TaxID=2026886 RepID=UPI00247BAAD8|nr:hypothetical protein [Nitrosarchaeum sp.]MCV0412355.1 hypothetical protein [Nitrosarchaeum sp.]
MDETSLESKTFADIFEKSIKQFINNRESFLPLVIKNFSDGNREYNNYIEQLFHVMRKFEETFFEKSDKSLLKIFEDYTNEFSKLYLMHVDASRKNFEKYLETRLLIMSSWNEHMKKFTDNSQNKL